MASALEELIVYRFALEELIVYRVQKTDGEMW